MTDRPSTNPASPPTCGARYTGVLPAGECILAAGHIPVADHTDDRGRSWGDRLAEYPTAEERADYTRPYVPKFTAVHVTPEMERAATERARQAADEHERAAEWLSANSSPHPAEATVQRVTALYERWVKAGPPRIGTPISREWDKRLAELHAALNEPKER